MKSSSENVSEDLNEESEASQSEDVESSPEKHVVTNAMPTLVEHEMKLFKKFNDDSNDVTKESHRRETTISTE